MDIDGIRLAARDKAVKAGVAQADADAITEAVAAYMEELLPKVLAVVEDAVKMVKATKDERDELHQRNGERNQQAWERLTARVTHAEHEEQHWRTQYRDVLTRLEERTEQKEAAEAETAQQREIVRSLQRAHKTAAGAGDAPPADGAVSVAAPVTEPGGAGVTPGSLRTPEEWLRELHPGMRVLDPDGWRGRDGIGWDEPIGRLEFEERLAKSTVQGPVARRAYPCAVCAQPLPVPGPTDHDCKPIVVKQGGEDRPFTVGDQVLVDIDDVVQQRGTIVAVTHYRAEEGGGVLEYDVRVRDGVIAAQPKTVHRDPHGGEG